MQIQPLNAQGNVLVKEASVGFQSFSWGITNHITTKVSCRIWWHNSCVHVTVLCGDDVAIDCWMLLILALICGMSYVNKGTQKDELAIQSSGE